MKGRPSRFVRTVQVFELDRDGISRRLLTDTLFVVHDAVKKRISLPRLQGGRIRLVLQGQGEAFLEPIFHYERTSVLQRYRGVEVPLEEITRESRGGVTVLRLARPDGVTFDLLRLETRSEFFDREVEVHDKGRGGRAGGLLARGRYIRLPGAEPVELLDMAVRRQPRGDHLRVIIHDGDSPPLEEIAFTALVRQPGLLFYLPPRGEEVPAGTLRYGGGRSHPPVYDIASLLPAAEGPGDDPRVRAGAALLDISRLARATLGPVRPNALFDDTPALAWAMHPGASLDVRLFRHEQPVQVPRSPEGLVRLRLRPEALARLRPDLNDARIVDGDGRQWPFLLHRRAGREKVTLEASRSKNRDGSSRFDLLLPSEPVHVDGLILWTRVPYFDRPYRVLGKAPGGDWARVSSGRLRGGAGPDGHAVKVDISFRPAWVEGLQLVVVDGDDAPLRFETVRAWVVVSDLFLTAPAGEYRLLLGEPEAEAPRYELERVRGVVLAVKAAEASAGPVRDNPDYRSSARLGRGEGPHKAMLWAALVAAVFVLGALTFWLARREPPSPAE
jgi:hypothetical protein